MNKYLSYIEIFILLICVLIRVDYEIVYFNLDSDKVFQMIGGSSLFKHNSVDFSYVLPNDLNKLITNNVEGYPAGYSIVFGFINHFIDPLRSIILVDSIVVVCLIFVFYSLMKNINIKQLERCVILFFVFCLNTSPFYYFTSTDKIIALIFLVNLNYYILNKLSLNFFNLSFIGGLNSIMFCFKFSSIPYILIIPFYNLIIKRNIRALKESSIVLLFTCFIIFIFNLLMPFESKATEKRIGLYFDQLVEIDPFLFKSFFNIEGLLNNYIQNDNVFIVMKLFMHLFSLYIFGLILVATFIGFKSKRKDNFQIFSELSVLVILFIVGFLSFLTIVVPSEEWSSNTWTYVEETRYYSIAMLLTEILFLVYLLQNRSKVFNKLLLILVFGFNILYFTNHLFSSRLNTPIKYSYRDYGANVLTNCELLSKVNDLESYIFIDEYRKHFTYQALLDHRKVLDVRELMNYGYVDNPQIKFIIHCKKERVGFFLNLLNRKDYEKLIEHNDSFLIKVI